MELIHSITLFLQLVYIAELIIGFTLCTWIGINRDFSWFKFWTITLVAGIILRWLSIVSQDWSIVLIKSFVYPSLVIFAGVLIGLLINWFLTRIWKWS